MAAREVALVSFAARGGSSDVVAVFFCLCGHTKDSVVCGVWSAVCGVGWCVCGVWGVVWDRGGMVCGGWDGGC